tara:strand:+ start:258 stop:899 length:642 start_codon:yes stop_codon:yes gene_type:complete
MSNKEAIAALAAAQSKMKTPHKDATNPHYGNKYASLKSCIKAIKPALNDNNFALVQSAGRDELGDFVETIFEHTSGGKFQSKFYLSPDKKGMQGMGSAATYAKRYGLLGLAGIEPDEETDDDASAANDDEIKAAAEAAHDAAVREEQNTEPAELKYKEDILAALDRCKEAWQLDKVVQENYNNFTAIKKYSQEMANEIQAFYEVKLVQIQEGK